MCIFKSIEDEQTLVGQVPIYISSLLNNFLKDNKTNSVSQRKREFDLVVPATNMVYTENKLAAEILDNELAKRKRMFTVLYSNINPQRFLENSHCMIDIYC